MKRSGPTWLGKKFEITQLNWQLTWCSAILRGLSKACLFFFGILQQHPSEHLQHLTSTLIPLIESQPRLVNFSAERDFAYAIRRWGEKVKALRIEMDKVPEVNRFDGFENWWDRLSDIIGIFEGRSDVLQRACEDFGADWKEYVWPGLFLLILAWEGKIYRK